MYSIVVEIIATPARSNNRSVLGAASIVVTLPIEVWVGLSNMNKRLYPAAVPLSHELGPNGDFAFACDTNTIRAGGGAQPIADHDFITEGHCPAFYLVEPAVNRNIIAKMRRSTIANLHTYHAHEDTRALDLGVIAPTGTRIVQACFLKPDHV